MIDRKLLVQLLGATFIVLGFLGFVANPILDLFVVNQVTNLVYVITGILALLMSNSEVGARNFGTFMSAVYGLMTVLGLMMGEGYLFGVMAMNQATSYLHLAFFLVFVYIGFGKEVKAPSKTKSSKKH